MNIIYRIFLLVVSCSSLSSVYSQGLDMRPPEVIIPPPVTSSFSNQFNNYLWMNPNFNIARKGFAEKVIYSGEIHWFVIELAGDSLLYAKTKIDVTTRKNCIRAMSKGWERAFTPEMTKSISTMSNGIKMVGIPSDSCWFFIVEKGRINAYSPLAELKLKYVTAIQKDNGPILPLTAENLRQMTGVPSGEVEKLIQEKELIKALQKYNMGR
jgi:hypothetical protein